ncbi:hypothetical protein [Dickeya ananatis]|uniref:hypothetical protein n=1 Tax=Dickeya ananatis TaxID=3061286 RepID=UPI00388DFD5A
MRLLESVLYNQRRLVVILVVLTGWELRVSLIISQLLAKAIPVRGAKFRKSRCRKASAFLFFYPDNARVKHRPDKLITFPNGQVIAVKSGIT